MKKLLVASAAALLLGTFAASANDSYVSVLGGPTWMPASMSAAPRPLDTGFNVGARYGYSWTTEPASLVEADGLFGQSNFNGINNGRLQTSSYMGNVVYHLPMNDTPFSVYGGAGIGAVNTNFDKCRQPWRLHRAGLAGPGRRRLPRSATMPACSPNTATRTPMT